MKILAAGDLHGDTNQAKKLALKAHQEKVDLVILCGDITNNDQKTNYIISEFKKKNKDVLFVTGNHETFATGHFIQDFYNITNLHGYSMKINDIGFFGCGGANIGIEQINDDEVFKILEKSHDKIQDAKKKIMVSHVHPSDSKVEKICGFSGSNGLRQAIKKIEPDYLLFAHIHETEGLEEKIGKTKAINVGKKGHIIDI